MEIKTMTVKEMAAYLGVHLDTVYKMARANEIPHFRLRSKILFSKGTVDAWIENQQEQSKGN
ncbi:DNA-binding protein [Oceanobacillus arenosus]|uniref:DNA-binding protein n=1 Tax=Oceanobacillus arenosus TaxID=1229153 RepID=A0A3D8PPC7_9BACI|nr:helix-turn-helix domain-containing protein [Oceanobacillus arenosus]RDW17098.1 DNA-binding protein [Oceanobacillus arenosus]